MMSTFDKHDLSGFIGKHLVYTYDNGWNYEIYVKNGHTLDYRIHSGIVGNRWVKIRKRTLCGWESIYKSPDRTDRHRRQPDRQPGRQTIPRHYFLPALDHE